MWVVRNLRTLTCECRRDLNANVTRHWRGDTMRSSNQSFSTCTLSPSMIDTIEGDRRGGGAGGGRGERGRGGEDGRRRDTRECGRAVCYGRESPDSRVRYERKRHRRNARMYSRGRARRRAQKLDGGMIARRNWNLLVCSKSALLNDVSIEKRLDVRYWMD